jgi:hypothetical protein
VVYVLAIVAAAVVAVGEVVQQRWAAAAPPELNLSPRLLLWLVRRPAWLGGIVCSFVGNGLFAAALNVGSVIRVEAVFLIRLVFVLIVAAIWNRHRIPRREVLGGVTITVGLVGFLLAAQPGPGSPGAVPDLRWAVGAGATATVAALLAVVAARTSGRRRAMLLGAGAGILFGLQATLIQSAVRQLAERGVIGLLAGWHAYAVVVVALAGMLLVQSAFETAPIEASYPAVVVAQLVTAVAIGVGVVGVHIRADPLALAVLIPAFGLMVLGVVALASSPLVTARAGNDAAEGR